MVQVQLGRRKLGQVEESFMKGLRPGDVFVLNGRTIRLVETRLLTAKVAAADSSVPTVPRWYANKMPLASGLAAEVVRLRTEVAKRIMRKESVSPVSERIGPELAHGFFIQSTAATKVGPYNESAVRREMP